MADKKKYPWIKSIFKRKIKTSPECVYAGPEYFAKKNEAKEVYAGPEQFSMNPVYAAPEVLAGRRFEMPTYTGPELPPDDPGIEEVYAGPEFFSGIPDEPEEGIDAPVEDDEEQIRPVPPEPVPMMCVYAGPEIMSGSYRPIPVPAPDPTKPVRDPEIKGDGRKCPACGALIIEGSPFCHECGTPLSAEKDD